MNTTKIRVFRALAAVAVFFVRESHSEVAPLNGAQTPNSEAQNGQPARTGVFIRDGQTISLKLEFPKAKITLPSSTLRTIILDDWVDTYLGSNIALATNYDEWKKHVSSEYAQIVCATPEKFLEIKALKVPPKAGNLIYWLRAESEGLKMLYVVEELDFGNGPHKLQPALTMYRWTDGTWKCHLKDPLKLVGDLSISKLEILLKHFEK